MTRITTAALSGILALAACADPALDTRIADLETQVKTLNEKVTTLEARPAGKGGPPAANAAEEAAAGELLRQANDLAQALKYDEAKAKLAELKTKHGATRAARSSARLDAELAVVGIDAGDLEVESWFQGNANMNDGKATMLVFWETWCPHCRREVPNVQATFDKYNSKGLNVIALTKITKSSTPEKVSEFIGENNLSYPIAKEKDGSMSSRFGVRGIPAAAMVKDGKVVWRGHPARLTEEMIEGWIN
ncbi:MAG: TlpA family protein disulfide reductase [Proteobacteria bacterium]|nr:TlpA family protein disulfide reductase [Pseudomonadota bacterium]